MLSNDILRSVRYILKANNNDLVRILALGNVEATAEQIAVWHLPLNLNIEEFKGEQLRVTGDTDITVRTMLLKVSSIDGNTKLDALDIDTNQGIVNASGTAQLSDNWPVDITLNSTLNVEPLKGDFPRSCARFSGGGLWYGG